ncbi:MAG: hypothetical protein CM1200mP26_01370 [Acidimicrobiales bacterium]|nr:MAG: hypothetical protein CM1200mP26_01370 [Acidimicrobiales bacterium]
MAIVDASSDDDYDPVADVTGTVTNVDDDTRRPTAPWRRTGTLPNAAALRPDPYFVFVGNLRGHSSVRPDRGWRCLRSRRKATPSSVGRRARPLACSHRTGLAGPLRVLDHPRHLRRQRDPEDTCWTWPRGPFVPDSHHLDRWDFEVVQRRVCHRPHASTAPSPVPEQVEVAGFDCSTYPSLIQVIGTTGVGHSVKQLDLPPAGTPRSSPFVSTGPRRTRTSTASASTRSTGPLRDHAGPGVRLPGALRRRRERRVRGPGSHMSNAATSTAREGSCGRGATTSTR